MPNHLQRGMDAENEVCEYLQQHGLTFITKNFRCKCGEIDLIMRDKNCLVFVEVRYRVACGYAHSAESVTYSKQKKIRLTAQFYLQKSKLFDKVACRFDVVAIDVINNETRVNWIKNAF